MNKSIEEINREQLVTATDHLLVCGRPRRIARGSMANIATPELVRAAVVARTYERTHLVRRRCRSVAPLAWFSSCLLIGVCAWLLAPI